MEEANTLAHYDKTTITAVKSFIVQAPGAYPKVEVLLLGLNHKQQTKQEKIAKDKHSSLLQTFVNYGCKKFYNIGAWKRFK